MMLYCLDVMQCPEFSMRLKYSTDQDNAPDGGDFS